MTVPIRSRSYEQDDFPRVRDLLMDSISLAGPPFHCSVGDLDFWCVLSAHSHGISGAQVWVDDSGSIRGVAWPDEEAVDLFVHPHHLSLVDAMLYWAERQRAASRPPGQAKLPLICQAFEGDAFLEEVLRSRGYERTEFFSRHRARPLSVTPPNPTLPPGYAISNTADLRDLSSLFGAHDECFPHFEMSADRYALLMASPTYRKDLDLVAAADDGTVAAFCIAWFDERNRLGVFEPVGCHPEHRRKGLSSVLMSEGMRRLRDLGADTAIVKTANANAASNPLYESLGFREIGRQYSWKKIL